jgi:hypothetical protein
LKVNREAVQRFIRIAAYSAYRAGGQVQQITRGYGTGLTINDVSGVTVNHIGNVMAGKSTIRKAPIGIAFQKNYIADFGANIFVCTGALGGFHISKQRVFTHT